MMKEKQKRIKNKETLVTLPTMMVDKSPPCGKQWVKYGNKPLGGGGEQKQLNV